MGLTYRQFWRSCLMEAQLAAERSCVHDSLRRVVESFVYFGWEPAIRRAQELPELFR